MDSTDDDFGELYVDDKVHLGKRGSDAFAGGDAGFVKSSEESKFATDSGKDMGFEGSVNPDSEGETKKLGAVAEDSSPCDDDACAVNLSEANEEESEYSDSDSDDDLKIVLQDDDDSKADACADAVEASKACSFQRRWTKYASSCTDPSFGMSQYGYSFSNNWSRTPFDVNLDLLETKPWRNHGMDISDFFNFGLNEQSWKDYCKPLGRAIEVGGGTFERIPSADLRRRRDSDPDVVIQIPVTNDAEETPEKSRSLNITSNEASRSEDSLSDSGKDLNSVDDSPKDEAFEGSQDENTGSFNGEQSPPTENCCSKEITTPSDKEMIEDEKEESFCSSDEADSSSVERESSLGDRIRLSPTSSCSVGNNEESDDSETESLKDSATDDQREVSTPPRQARLAEHEASSIEREERNGTMHSRHERSDEDSTKKHCGRAGYAVHGRIKYRTVKDASSPTPDPSCGRNVRSRHESLYRDSNKNRQNGSRITLERDETEGKGFHYSKREKRHDRLYPSVDHARHREQRFGWRSNNKESSLGRAFDHSNSYNCEARRKEYTSHSSLDLNQRNSRSSFKEEDDRYGWHHCERNYGHERSPVRAYENNKQRYGYDWLREPYYEDCLPLTDMDYRYRSEYSSAYAIHEQNRENDLHCRRRGDYDYNLHRLRYEDGCYRAEGRISFDREMRYFAEVERREFRGYKRHEELSEIEKRHDYTHDWHLDRFLSEEDGYKCRSEDAWPSPSLPLRDSWYKNEAKGNFRRDDTRDFRTVEAYDSQNNQFYKAAPRDGWTHSRGRSDKVSVKDRLKCADDWVRPDRRRYNLADDIQCSMTEVTHPEHPSYTDEILLHNLGIPTHNRMAIKQRSGYKKSHIHEIDERRHRSKRLRGRDGQAFIKRQDPVDLAGRQGKLSNQSKRGFSNGQDTIEQQQGGQKSGKLMCRSEEKAVRVGDTNDKEEGEIIEGETNVKVVEIDNERIQESLKKMEKRRERFKDTKMAKTVEATEPRAKTADLVTNQQRPARKRRWCAAS